MGSNGIKLSAITVEAIARRGVELLRERVESQELVDAAELARRLGVERSWVYTHAIELGAVKLGRGPRPRLRFDPKLAAFRMAALGRDTQEMASQPRRRPRRPAPPTGPGLLPIKRDGAS